MAAPSDSVIFEDLPLNADDETLNGVFGAYGLLKSAQFLPASPITGKRSAVVQYETAEDAKWIVDNLNGNVPQGLSEPIKCMYKPSLPTTFKGKGHPFGNHGNQAFGNQAGKEGCKGGGKEGGKDGGKDGGKEGMESKGKGKGKPDDMRAGRPGPYELPAPAALPAPLPGKTIGSAAGMLAPRAPLANPCPSPAVPPVPPGKTSIKTLVEGILDSGALPGGVKYSNDQNTLFIGGLPRDTTDLELYQIFAPFGAVAPKGILAMRGGGPGPNCKGYGFVNYMSAQAAEKAINTLHGTTMPGGAVLRVMPKRLESKASRKGSR